MNTVGGVLGFTFKKSDGDETDDGTSTPTFDAHYYLLVDEWNYPTESGREPHDETYDTLDEALKYAKSAAEAEEPTFDDVTGTDCLPAAIYEEPDHGDCGGAILTCKNGLDRWYFATRVFKVDVLPR